MWKETILNMCHRSTFADGATIPQLEEIERLFNLSLPKELKALLLESNGVLGPHDLGVIWNTTEIKECNLLMRNDEGLRRAFMPFDHLLFFGADGGGD